MATKPPTPRAPARTAAPDPRDGPTGTEKNPLVPPDASKSDHENTPASTQPTARARKKLDEVLVKVKVKRGFKLTRDDGIQVAYAAGEQTMPEADAEHWYTKHHLAADED